MYECFFLLLRTVFRMLVEKTLNLFKIGLNLHLDK
jgi:hypothetical protein